MVRPPPEADFHSALMATARTVPTPEPDVLLNDRVDMYVDAIRERFIMHLNLFFPKVRGSRMPILTKTMTERLEFLYLRETARLARKVEAGEEAPTLETSRFIRNADGAADRLIELGRKFGESNGAS